MLHEFDGYDERWEAELNNLHTDEEEQRCFDKIRRRVVKAVQNNDDFSDVGHLRQNMNNIGYANALDNDLNVEISTEHDLLRDKLVRHLNIEYLNGKLRWLKI
jgi:ubiquinone biosynthesis protein COQ9